MNNMVATAFNFREMEQFASQVCKTDFVPHQFKNNGSAVLAAIQYGKELGMPPMQAINSLNVIKGKVSMSVEMMKAVVMGSGLCEYALDDTNPQKCTVRIKRKGSPADVVREFSIEDARKAGLVKPNSPWITYPSRMVYARAMGFALRDVFPDVLAGIVSEEEAADYPEPISPAIKDIHPSEQPKEVEILPEIEPDISEKDEILEELKILLPQWKAADKNAKHSITLFLTGKKVDRVTSLPLPALQELKAYAIDSLTDLQELNEEAENASHSHED